jgi:putative transposase
MANPKDWIAIDINESNVTAVSSNPHILKMEHELRTIHTTYFNIRRRIQKLAKEKPKTAQRLLKSIPIGRGGGQETFAIKSREKS